MASSASLLIRKVQNKDPLTKTEISDLIEGFQSGEVPEYQMSAFLMAVYYQGLSEEEKEHLTFALLSSGKKMNWPQTEAYMDKHSTGGIGDKTSIIITPLLASMGYKVPMMSGRGLGHTGGTLDKMESLVGLSTNLSLKDFENMLSEYGGAMIGQTDDFCPADRKLYALRDVTCTVSSLPLITASIVSKKIAEGSKYLVYDVKTGSGAFIKNLKNSKALAESLVQTSEKLGARSVALITDMSQPLGRYVGNSCEMFECFEILKDAESCSQEFKDTIELSLELCAHLISLVKDEDPKKLYQDCKEQLWSGAAFTKAQEMFKAQGWNGDLPKIYETQFDWTSPADGYVATLDCEQIGWACVELGGGRKVLSDKIDPDVGFYFFKKHGDAVKKGEPLVRLFYRSEEKLKSSLQLLEKAFSFSSTPPPSLQLIQDAIKGK